MSGFVDVDYFTGDDLSFEPEIDSSDGFITVQFKRVKSQRRISNRRLQAAELPISKCPCGRRLDPMKRQKTYCSRQCMGAARGKVNQNPLSDTAVFQALRFEFGLGCTEIAALTASSVQVVYHATDGDSTSTRVVPWWQRQDKERAIEAARKLL